MTTSEDHIARAESALDVLNGQHLGVPEMIALAAVHCQIAIAKIQVRNAVTYEHIAAILTSTTDTDDDEDPGDWPPSRYETL